MRTQAALAPVPSGGYLYIDARQTESSLTIQYLVTGSPTISIEGSVDGTNWVSVLPGAITASSGLISLSRVLLLTLRVSYTGTGTVSIGYVGA